MASGITIIDALKSKLKKSWEDDEKLVETFVRDLLERAFLQVTFFCKLFYFQTYGASSPIIVSKN